MQWYEEEVRGLEARIRTCNLSAPVVFYGSSTMRLWETLAQDLRSDDLLNLAFGGSTLEACVWFFERLPVAAKARSLVLYAGDNDLGDGRSPGQVVDSFLALVAKLKTHLPDIPFGFISVKPSPSRLPLIDSMRQTNAAVQGMLGLLPNAYFIDVFSAMLDETGRPVAGYYQPDGLHLSPAGYRQWADVIDKHRSRIFGDTPL